MKPAATTQIDFEKDLKKEGVTLVDFWAEWCGPCKMIAPVLEELGEDRQDLQILKIDVDENQEIAQDFGIRSIPTLLVFKNGELVDRYVGAMNKTALLMKLSEHLDEGTK